jgi:hypothetical protein
MVIFQAATKSARRIIIDPAFLTFLKVAHPISRGPLSFGNIFMSRWASIMNFVIRAHDFSEQHRALHS